MFDSNRAWGKWQIASLLQRLRQSPARERFTLLLLGVNSTQSQRNRNHFSIRVVVLFVLFAAVQQFEVWYGLIDQTASNALSAYNIIGSVCFYFAVRFGYNLRVVADPSLSFFQCLFGISSASAAYAISGPARGSIIAIMLIILIYAMFSSKPFQIRRLSKLLFLGLALAMVAGHVTQPERYPIAVELTHAVIALIIVAFTSSLSVRMGILRAMLEQQKADLEEALELNKHLVALDDLTGLATRRHMRTALMVEHEQQQRCHEQMSIALIDIDMFKNINDRYGHSAGDLVLCEFARTTLESLRGRDSAARWGGEEFLVLMPKTSCAEAILAIERLRATFEKIRFHEIDNNLRVTFSAGVATCVPLESIDNLVERADQNMYKAKSGGRNFVFADILMDDIITQRPECKET